MKQRQLLAGAALIAAWTVGGQLANASPFTFVPSGPVLIHLNDDEQFAAGNNITGPNNATPYPAINAPGTEGNWGIVEISSVQQGTVLSPVGSDIQGGGATLFTNNSGPNAGQQFLGIFYGVHVNSVSTTMPSLASGGVLDLYGFSGAPIQNVGTEIGSSSNLSKRTAQNQYTDYTCAAGNTSTCTFLARLDFVYGANGAGDTTTTIVSPTNPATGDGTAQSYLSVDTTVPGLWTSILNDNFFTLDPNNAPLPDTPDVRLSNSFSHNGASAWNVGTDVFGLTSSDPGRAATISIPEPTSLSLLAAAFMGFGALGRRRKAKRG